MYYSFSHITKVQGKLLFLQIKYYSFMASFPCHATAPLSTLGNNSSSQKTVAIILLYQTRLVGPISWLCSIEQSSTPGDASQHKKYLVYTVFPNPHASLMPWCKSKFLLLMAQSSSIERNNSGGGESRDIEVKASEGNHKQHMQCLRRAGK